MLLSAVAWIGPAAGADPVDVMLRFSPDAKVHRDGAVVYQRGTRDGFQFRFYADGSAAFGTHEPPTREDWLVQCRTDAATGKLRSCATTKGGLLMVVTAERPLIGLIGAAPNTPMTIRVDQDLPLSSKERWYGAEAETLVERLSRAKTVATHHEDASGRGVDGTLSPIAIAPALAFVSWITSGQVPLAGLPAERLKDIEAAP